MTAIIPMTPIFASALLVEDEINLQTALSVALQQLQIPAIFSASTLKEASQILVEKNIELILLDRKLPDGDGMTLCQTLRESHYRGSILMLTAFSDPKDRVAGLNQGADDYLPKPFSWEELTARIRALGRRKGAFQHPQESPLWKLNPKQLQIRGVRGWVTLTPLEYKLVETFIANEGKIISRKTLLKHVWGFQSLPQTRTVDFFLSRLRKYFEVDPEKPKHFITVRGAGYQFRF